jgi:hypothetical protein
MGCNIGFDWWERRAKQIAGLEAKKFHERGKASFSAHGFRGTKKNSGRNGISSWHRAAAFY